MSNPFLGLGFNSWAQKFSKGNVFVAFLQYVTTGSTSSFTLLSTGTVDYEVDWGDGSTESLTTNAPTHTYSSAGEYTIKVTPAEGSTYRPYFNNVVSDTSIASVSGTGGSQLGTNLSGAWKGASNITSFSSNIDISSVTDFIATWDTCSSLTSFPVLDTSSGTNFQQTWFGCSSLTSFPLINTSSGNSFAFAWVNASSLTSFPSCDFSSATSFTFAWSDCSSLTTFPANMFDTTGTLSSNAFGQAWTNCALTAQSIENILVSLDTNGTSNIDLNISGGTNAAKTTWSAAANTAYNNLITKGWSITYNA